MSYWQMVMKLAAIYNVFDGEELLKGSVESIRKDVDIFIFVVSTVGQSGEEYHGGIDEVNKLDVEKIVYLSNERELEKRNKGLDIARENGCTHFIFVDCDEYWDGLDRTQIDCAHRLHTFFKDPTYLLMPAETYFVPGICTLKPNTKVGRYDCGFYCDPTRKPNHRLREGFTWMYHYSYVRKNLERKIKNSSAYVNIQWQQDILMDDWAKAAPGYYVRYFQRTINKVENIFDIPHFYDVP